MVRVQTSEGQVVKKERDKTFYAEIYGMTFCPLCQGDGKLAKTPEGFEVCKECGGFGLIKMEKKASFRQEDNLWAMTKAPQNLPKRDKGGNF